MQIQPFDPWDLPLAPWTVQGLLHHLYEPWFALLELMSWSSSPCLSLPWLVIELPEIKMYNNTIQLCRWCALHVSSFNSLQKQTRVAENKQLHLYLHPGMDEVREREALLPGNDKENWGNYNTDLIGIWNFFFHIYNLAPEEEIILSASVSYCTTALS